MSSSWPRLSEELTQSRLSLFHGAWGCQRCGITGNDLDTEIQRWQEHDEHDRPEPIIVLLCGPCASKVIERHPRLYRRLDEHEPMAGAMPLCLECRFRKGTKCTHTDLKANEGPGLKITFPEPIMAHVRATKWSGFKSFYRGPVTSCAGYEMVEEWDSFPRELDSLTPP